MVDQNQQRKRQREREREREHTLYAETDKTALETRRRVVCTGSFIETHVVDAADVGNVL